MWTAAAVLAGCSRPPAVPAGAQAADPQPEADYAHPPELRAVQPAQGGVVLSGVADPDALIRLASPDGTVVGAAANHKGEWTLPIPASAVLRLFSLSQDVGGRPLRAVGYLAVLPAPSVGADILRPGSAAVPVRPARAAAITALDFDAAGVAVVSGLAPHNSVVRVSVDGAYVGNDHADSGGRFAVPLPQVLRAGPHTLQAQTPSGGAVVALDATPARATITSIYTAARSGRAWRIDWVTPAGGVQTTLLFDPPGAPS